MRYVWGEQGVVPAPHIRYAQWQRDVQVAREKLRQQFPDVSFGRFALRTTFLGWEAGITDDGLPQVFAVGLFEGDKPVVLRHGAWGELAGVQAELQEAMAKLIAGSYSKSGLAAFRLYMRWMSWRKRRSTRG